MRILVSEKLSAHKYKTPEGYLVCVDAILARTGKQEYRRSELFGDSCEMPDETIELIRPEDEVFSDKTLASFENKALCLDHPDEDVDSENHNQLSVGFVRDIKRGKDAGQDVMLGTLVVTDQDAIDKIESGEYGELSCGYNCDIDDTDNKYTQRNIRGNHVALCQHGRAGIARIVDSKPSSKAKADEWEIALRDRDIRFTRNGNTFTFPTLTDFQHARSTPLSEARFKEDWDKYTQTILDSKFNDGTKVSMYKSGYAVVDTKHWKQYGKNAYAERHCDTEDEAQYIARECRTDDRCDYIVVDCNTYKVVDAMDFSKKTKQGYDVLEMYRDGGRLHAVFKRANDYGVALGYDTTDGQWSQGMYDYTTLERAREALMKEKPYAKKIQDAVKDAYLSEEEKELIDYVIENLDHHGNADEALRLMNVYYSMYQRLARNKPNEVKEYFNEHVDDSIMIKNSVNDAKTEYTFNWRDTYHGTKDKTRVDANNIKEAIKKFGDMIALGGIGTANCYVISISPNDGYIRAYGKLSELLRTFKDCDVKDSTNREQLFTVKYKQNDTTYICKVRARTMQDAIKQVKSKLTDERLSPMTYRALKALGVTSQQWSHWTQEQASAYIAKRKQNSSTSSNTKNTSSNTKNTSSTSLSKAAQRFVNKSWSAQRFVETGDLSLTFSKKIPYIDVKPSEIDAAKELLASKGLNKTTVVKEGGSTYLHVDKAEYQQYAESRPVKTSDIERRYTATFSQNEGIDANVKQSGNNIVITFEKSRTNKPREIRTNQGSIVTITPENEAKDEFESLSEQYGKNRVKVDGNKVVISNINGK